MRKVKGRDGNLAVLEYVFARTAVRAKRNSFLGGDSLLTYGTSCRGLREHELAQAAGQKGIEKGVSMATAVKPGFFSSWRKANLRSFIRWSVNSASWADDYYSKANVVVAPMWFEP